MPSSSITSVDIESGSNTRDALLTTVTGGDATVRLEKGAPKSYLKEKVEEIQKDNPRCFSGVKKMITYFSLGLYYADIISDVNLLFTFLSLGHMDWFYFTLLFLCLNQLFAIVGIVVNLRKKKELPTIALLCASPFIIIAPLFLDVCMAFYRLLQNRLPDSFVTFMVQYEATRLSSERFVESLPQACLQVYIYMHCLDVICAGIEKEGQSALLVAFYSSGASFLFNVIKTIYEMRKEGLNCCGYFNSLIQMGAGLPLRAIVSNTIKELEITHDLLDAEIRSLEVVLRSNTSIEKIEVRKQNDGNGLAMVLGELLKTNNTLTELDLSNNNITDVQSIGEGLKTNNTLTGLILYDNNITDDSGIQSIIDGLKTNNTLSWLDLRNNQLSDNMISQLKAIEQYKKDGSNGYQQVKGMDIYTHNN